MLRLDSDKEASKEMIDLLERIVRGYYEFILRIMFLSDDEVRVIFKEGYVSLLQLYVFYLFYRLKKNLIKKMLIYIYVVSKYVKKNDFDYRRINVLVIFFFNKENLKFLVNLKFI